jgi:hypothetical protein
LCEQYWALVDGALSLSEVSKRTSNPDPRRAAKRKLLLGLNCSKQRFLHVKDKLWDCEDPVRFEVLTAVTMRNVVFWDTKSQFVLHRRHITSPLQRDVKAVWLL